MNTKTFYGIDFKVYTETEINGDFIKDEAVYFENDIVIHGKLKVKYLKTLKSITVDKSYEVEKWEEVGGSQKVGGYQEVGRSQIKSLSGKEVKITFEDGKEYTAIIK